MAIKLRVNQATALTYKEMDRNFSSFFYSASIQNGDTLQLWYTGSSALNGPGENYEPYPVTIPLQPTDGATPTLIVAGTEDGHIQIKNGNQLGYSSEFIYNSQGFLGVGTGTPSVKAHIRGTTNTPSILRLESINTVTNLNRKSVIEFNHGVTNYGIVGRDNYADNNLYIKTYNDPITLQGLKPNHGKLIVNIGSNTNSGAWTSKGLGIGTLAPTVALHVEGAGYFASKVGIGIAPLNATLNLFESTQLQSPQGGHIHLGRFANVPLSSVNALNVSIVRTAAGPDWQTSGMRIQQQVDSEYMGYLQFSGDDNNYGISMGTGTSGPNGSILIPTERFRIDNVGRVCIGTKVGTEILTVQGNISGSGFVKVNGTATVGTIAAGSAATTSALVATSAGLLQKIDAAPIPKGGIILWSGAINTIPAGWRLCDGGTINGMTTPNLQDKFIVGAGSAYAVATTGGSADAIIVAHTHTATSIDSGHTHNWGYGTEQDDSGTGGSHREFTKTAATNSPAVPSPILASSANITTTINSAGESGTNKNLPPYYALAYIMYGGI